MIAKFVGPRPPSQEMRRWLQTLNQELRGSMWEKGFFFLLGNDRDALSNALMLSPYKTKRGTCMFQSWIPGFNPDKPNNLAFPMWVTLGELPFEHHDQALRLVIVELIQQMKGK